MYAQVEKPKENQSRAAANSATQKKSDGKKCVGFVDNRTKAIAQRKMPDEMNEYPIQKFAELNHDFAKSHPIQRRLIINSWRDGYTQRIKNALNNLLGGGGFLDFQNSFITPILRRVGLTSTTEVQQGANYALAPNANARTLLGRIILSARTVKIQDLPANGATPVAQGGEAPQTTMLESSYNQVLNAPRTGRDVRVGISSASLQGGAMHNNTQVPVDSGVGGLAQVATPDPILVGHELIHSDRIQRGVSAFRGTSVYHPGFGLHDTPDERFQENLVNGTQYARATTAEDIFTVGLTPRDIGVQNPDLNAITENDLRNEQGLERRVGYN